MLLKFNKNDGEINLPPYPKFKCLKAGFSDSGCKWKGVARLGRLDDQNEEQIQRSMSEMVLPGRSRRPRRRFTDTIGKDMREALVEIEGARDRDK